MSFYHENYFLTTAGSVTAKEAVNSLHATSKSGDFDVFLSHSVRDARVILGLYKWLTSQKLRVYVDWINDPQMDRTSVSPATAAQLRKQMMRSRNLLYASSRAARESRWMPWELGYFDGVKSPERVAIMPLESESDREFAGEEYLGLYKTIEQVEVNGRMQPYAVRPSRKHGESLRSFGSATGHYKELVIQ